MWHPIHRFVWFYGLFWTPLWDLVGGGSQSIPSPGQFLSPTQQQTHSKPAKPRTNTPLWSKPTVILMWGCIVYVSCAFSRHDRNAAKHPYITHKYTKLTASTVFFVGNNQTSCVGLQWSGWLQQKAPFDHIGPCTVTCLSWELHTLFDTSISRPIRQFCLV